jgi:AraC family transcriptional regulator of arabinose operon
MRVRRNSVVGSKRIVARRARGAPGYHVVREHGTSDWLLIHCVSGCGRVAIAGREALVPPGTAALFPAGCHHDYGTAPGHDHWGILWTHFLPRDGWEPLLAWPSPIQGPGILAVAGETRAQVEIAFDLCISASGERYAGDQQLSLSALEVVLRLFHRVDPGASAAIDQRVRDAMDAISAEPRLAADIPRLARVAGLSTSRFAHLFRAGAGMSPGHWAELVRLRGAASMLLATADPIAEIAGRVGYHDAFYFSARFRRHFGVSPRAYRQGLHR